MEQTNVVSPVQLLLEHRQHQVKCYTKCCFKLTAEHVLFHDDNKVSRLLIYWLCSGSNIESNTVGQQSCYFACIQQYLSKMRLLPCLNVFNTDSSTLCYPLNI